MEIFVEEFEKIYLMTERILQDVGDVDGLSDGYGE